MSGVRFLVLLVEIKRMFRLGILLAGEEEPVRERCLVQGLAAMEEIG